MEIVLGRLSGEVERPQTQKFAWPIVILPEIFTTRRTLAVLVGYLASIGWEVYALDVGGSGGDAKRTRRFADVVDAVAGALEAIGSEAIVAGHGLGGLIALKLAEHPRVKASVAITPLVPGFDSPLFDGVRNRLAIKFGRKLRPPTGRRLFEFVADADVFQREAIIKSSQPENSTIVAEVLGDAIDFGRAESAPRLVISGDADIFAPAEEIVRLGERLGARVAMLHGRGHWLISGRALERVVAESQRFLVRALGQELLLLYSDENKGGDAGGSSGEN